MIFLFYLLIIYNKPPLYRMVVTVLPLCFLLVSLRMKITKNNRKHYEMD